jgi:hypothetical protein
MAKTKAVRVTEEELAMLRELRRQQGEQVALTEEEEKQVVVSESQQALADAFVKAIERTRPPEKKTVFNRKKGTPWTPKDGEPRLKLRRKMYHHGIEIGERVSNEEIDLLNRIKEGTYCDGWVKVTKRKDQGLDVDYAVRTNSQRLKLINTYGIRSFTELLQRIVDEAKNPAKYRKEVDSDLYELQQ